MKRVSRFARWAFPVITLLVTVAVQVVVPRVLQIRLSDAEYVAYVAVMALTAYIGLADGGLQMTVLREMSALHGANDRPRFAYEVLRARRIFAVMVVVGLVIAAATFGSAYDAATHAWDGADTINFKFALSAQFVAASAILGAGGYHSVILFATGRLLLAQVVGLASIVAPLVGLIAILVVERNLAMALLVHAGLTVAIALARASHAFFLQREETRGVTLGEPLTPLRSVLGVGVALKIADVLPNAAFPHLLTVLAAAYVPAAIPGRTYAGAPRLFARQFLSLLQVHITRRMAAGPEARVQGIAQYRAAATFLTAIHLLQLGVVGAIAVPVFELWLPMRAPEISVYLPGMFAEQALLSASLPAAILFAAVDRLGLLGAARIVGVLVGIGTFLLVLSPLGEAAFGVGLAVSALPTFALGLYSECRPIKDFPERSRSVIARYAAAVVSSAACAAYTQHPTLVSAFVGGCGLILLPRPTRSLFRMFRGVAPDES